MLSIILFFPFYYALTYSPVTKKYTFFDNFSTNKLNIYAFEEDGRYHDIGLELKRGLQKNIVDDVSVFETQGSKDNIFKIAEEVNSIGFCQSDVYFKYIDSISSSVNIRDNVTIIDELYEELLHIINVCPNSENDTAKKDCEKIISGKFEDDISIIPILQSSNIGEENSGTRFTMITLIDLLHQEWGQGSKRIDTSKLGDKKISESLNESSKRDSSTDTPECITLVATPEHKMVKEFLKLEISKFIGVDSNIVEKLNEKIPGEIKLSNKKCQSYFSRDLGYNNPETIGVHTFLIANTKLAKEVVDATVDYINKIRSNEEAFSILGKDISNNSNCKDVKPKANVIYKCLVFLLVSLFSATIPCIFLKMFYKNDKKIKSLKRQLETSKTIVNNTESTVEKPKEKILTNKESYIPQRENSLSIAKLDKHQMDYITLEICVKDKIFRTDENGKILPAIFEIRKKPKGLLTLIVYAHATKIDKPILSGSKKWVDPSVVANHKQNIKDFLKARYKKKAKDLISINNDDLFIIVGDKHKLKFNKENIKIDNDLLKLKEIKDFLKEYPELKKALTIQN